MRSSIVKAIKTQDKLTFIIEGAGEVEFDTKRVSSSCNETARMLGWETRIKSAILSKKTAREKLAMIQKIRDHYYTGTKQWSMKANVSDDEAMLLQTLRSLFPTRTPSEIRSHLERASEESRH